MPELDDETWAYGELEEAVNHLESALGALNNIGSIEERLVVEEVTTMIEDLMSRMSAVNDQDAP